jgi:hypothetical protein
MIEKPIHQKVQEAEQALADANNERATLQALALLVANNGANPAPNRIDLIAPDYKIVTVGIGRDHTATILVTEKDMKALQYLLEGDTDAR